MSHTIDSDVRDRCHLLRALFWFTLAVVLGMVALVLG
jgi:hypothetical protein